MTTLTASGSHAEPTALWKGSRGVPTLEHSSRTYVKQEKQEKQEKQVLRKRVAKATLFLWGFLSCCKIATQAAKKLAARNPICLRRFEYFKCPLIAAICHTPFLWPDSTIELVEALMFQP